MLQHVALETSRGLEAEALRFWELLGFEQIDPPESLRERAAWVERSGTQIHLLWSDEPVAPPSGHAAVVVEDYKATLARLHEAGFDVEPRTEHWGVPRAFAAAPGGHRVELMSAPPPRPA